MHTTRLRGLRHNPQPVSRLRSLIEMHTTRLRGLRLITRCLEAIEGLDPIEMHTTRLRGLRLKTLLIIYHLFCIEMHTTRLRGLRRYRVGRAGIMLDGVNIEMHTTRLRGLRRVSAKLTLIYCREDRNAHDPFEGIETRPEGTCLREGLFP
jgi:hypothetical protein